MKRLRIGISVGYDHVRLLAVRGSRVHGVAVAELDPETELEETLGSLLSELRLPRFPEPRAVLVVGPSRGQLRELSGLPESRDAGLLAEVVRQDPGRFFLRGGRPLSTTGVRPMGAGTAWAGAIEEPVLRAVQRACRAAGVRLDAATPLAAALARNLPDGRHGWTDGPVTAEIEVRGGSLVEATRRRAEVATVAPPAPIGLAALGTLAAPVPDAAAATLLAADEPLAIRFAPNEVPTWRVGIAAASLVIAAILAFALPLRRTEAAGRAAHAALARQSHLRRQAVRESGELVEVTRALAEVAGFSSERRSAVGFVSALARGLPAGSAVVSVRADTLGGTVAVLAPRAADALTQVEQLPGVREAALTGPVTREQIGERALERALIRFTWRRIP